jgi:hypothetical protein
LRRWFHDEAGPKRWITEQFQEAKAFFGREPSHQEGEEMMKIVIDELPWRDRSYPHPPLRENDLVADSICGTYVIRPSKSGKRFLLWFPDTEYEKPFVQIILETAKRNAQEDFERRVRSVVKVVVEVETFTEQETSWERHSPINFDRR